MKLGLEGKTAFVSGGSKGIGKAIALALADEGVNVNISGRDIKSLERTYGEISVKGVNCIIYQSDLLYTAKDLRFGNVDILINNVGGMGTSNNYPEIMRKNYGITSSLTYNFLKQNRPWGRVITIASIYGKEKGHNPGFDASKSAQIAYMKSLAGKYEGITFNTICPGHIDVGKPFPDNPKIIGKPDDIAGIVTFLCSDLAKHINGACITVDGGQSYSY